MSRMNKLNLTKLPRRALKVANNRLGCSEWTAILASQCSRSLSRYVLCMARTNLGCAVVEGWRSRPLDCEVRGSKPDQGRHLKRDFCFIRTPAGWGFVTRAGWGHKTPLYKTWIHLCYPTHGGGCTWKSVQTTGPSTQEPTPCAQPQREPATTYSRPVSWMESFENFSHGRAAGWAICNRKSK